MSDIFNEINEDLRRDSAKRFWERYGIYVIGLAVLIVIATAGWRLHEGWQAGRAAEAGDRYVEALRQAQGGDHAAAAAALDAFAAEAPEGYAMLARFRAASELAAAGDKAAAVSAFDTLAGDASLPADHRDLATLRAAQIALDVEDAAAVEARVAALGAGTSPWRFGALEVAAIAAIRSEDWEGARSALSRLLDDPETPGDISQRANMMMDLVIGTVGAPTEPEVAS